MLVSRETKNILYVLSGVTLEYFDVLLFIHLGATVTAALFYNDISFMAKTGFVFSFLSTIAFRPFGALLWGYIGDTYGRKICVTVTPFIVALSCAVMAFLPSYRAIGVLSLVIFFLLRMIQGLAWVGEKTAANVYITEMIEPKKANFYSSIAGISEELGGIMALGLINVCLYFYPENGWKYAFMVGGLIALFSIPLRRNLEESKEFLTSTEKYKENQTNEILYNTKSIFSNFFPVFIRFIIIEMTFAVAFFFIFIYGAEVLTKQFNHSPAMVAQHNMIISFLGIVFMLGYGLLSLKIDGLKIVRCRILVYMASIPFMFWYYLSGELTITKIYVIQSLIFLLGFGDLPCLPVLIKGLPTLIRMRGFALAYAIGKVIMYFFTTFVLAYFIEEIGPICIPYFLFFVASCVAWAIWTYPVHREYS